MLSIYDNDGTLGALRTEDMRFTLTGSQAYSSEAVLRSDEALGRLIREHLQSYGYPVINGSGTLRRSSTFGTVTATFVVKVDCGADIAAWEGNMAGIVQNAGLLSGVTVRADDRRTRCSPPSVSEGSNAPIRNIVRNGSTFIPSTPKNTDAPIPPPPAAGGGWSMEAIAAAMGVSVATAGVLLALGLILIVRR